MYCVAFLVCLLAYTCVASPLEADNDMSGEPEYLDMLLREGRYDEFNELMEIEIPELSRPGNSSTQRDPRYNPLLLHGDVLLTAAQREQGRQAINFDAHPSYKWPGYVPYTMSTEFSPQESQVIRDSIREFNSNTEGCINWGPRRNERDYVHIFPGQGCYSNLGRTGRRQVLSLQKNGCVYKGTVLHEMNHAIGFMHEQCRSDRDTYIRVLEENIKPEWRSQYEKTSASDFNINGPYDYYSIMHYPQRHPDVSNNLKAFDVLNSSIDERRIGSANSFTDIDKQKIKSVYCKK